MCRLLSETRRLDEATPPPEGVEAGREDGPFLPHLRLLVSQKRPWHRGADDESSDTVPPHACSTRSQ
jgi:hypothetical protein